MSRRRLGVMKLLPAFLLFLALLADNPKRIFADEELVGAKTLNNDAAADHPSGSDVRDRTTVEANIAVRAVESMSITTSNIDATTTASVAVEKIAAAAAVPEQDDQNKDECYNPGMVFCDEGKRCYHEVRDRCDELPSCFDNADELDCHLRCETGKFMCADKSDCVDMGSVCNGFGECLDDSDEHNCTDRKPCENPDDFQCHADGHCIQGHLRCDNEEHCHDGSDELDCHFDYPEFCPIGNFDCNNDGKHCIDNSKECDKHSDCPNGEDELGCTYHEKEGQVENEAGTLVKCDPAEYSCHHECHKIVSETNHHVKKICSCFEGYILAEDKVSCHIIGDEPQMWIAEGRTLVKYGLYKKSVLSRHDLRHNITSFTFDFKNGLLFWLPEHANAIAMTKMSADGSFLPRSGLINRAPNIYRPIALAYDWLSQNLYWADQGKSIEMEAPVSGTELNGKEAEEIRHAFGPKIGVISVGKKSEEDHTIVSPIIHYPHVMEPNALVVDPRPGQGFIYWTQVGKERGLYRAGADGSAVVALRKNDVVHPKALTIDYFHNCLYLVDNDKLYMDNFTGGSKVLYSFESVDLPNVFASLEGEIYWKDALSHSVLEHFIDNIHYKPVTLPGSASEGSKFMAVYHSYIQPEENGLPCQNHHGNCSHLCLSAPRYEGYICMCHDSAIQRSRGVFYELGDDKKACVRKNIKTTEDNMLGRVPTGLDTKGGNVNDSDYVFQYLDEDEVENRRQGLQVPSSPQVTEKKEPEKFTNIAYASSSGTGTSSVWIYFIAAVAGVAVIVAVVFVSIRYKRWKDVQKVENDTLGTPLKSSQDAPSNTGTSVTTNTTTNLLV